MNTFLSKQAGITSAAAQGLLVKLSLALALTVQLMGCVSSPAEEGPFPQVEGCRAGPEGFVLTTMKLDCDSVDHLDQLADNANFTILNISKNANAKNLDLSRFTKLNSVRIVNDTLETLTLPLLSSFASVSIEAAHLTKVQLPVKILELSFVNTPSLVQVGTSLTKINTLSITGPLSLNLRVFADAGIEALSARKSNFKSVDLGVFTHLKTAYFGDTDFNSTDLTSLTQLTSLTVAQGNMISLDLRNTAIRFVTLHGSNITTLYLSNEGSGGELTALEHVAESLTVVGGEGLQRVYLRKGALKSVDIASMRSLASLVLSDLQLATITLPNNSQYRNFGGANCPAGALACTVSTN